MSNRRRLQTAGVVLFFSILVVVSVPVGAADPPPQAAWQWSLDQSGAVHGEVVAVVRSPSGWLASGGARGVTLWVPGAMARRMALRAPVTDLAYDLGDRLWIASEAGVFRLDPGATEPVDVSPGSGEAARAALRIVAAGSEVAVSTHAGVFWRRGGAPWERIRAALGGTPARALTLVSRGVEPSTLWLATERGLFVSKPTLDRAARHHALPEAGAEIIDLLGANGVLWVLTARFLVEVDGGNRIHRVDGVPGASRRRLARSDGEFLLATERGLWLAGHPGGPWRRAAEPAGFADLRGVAGWPGGAALAGPRGLLHGERRPVLVQSLPHEAPPCGPAIVEVHRAVLDYLHLRGDPVARMRRGVRKRGWLPELRLQGRYVSDSDRTTDFDQNFVSGSLRELRDWDDESGRSRDISVALTWEFGDLLYHPEEIDVSTEARRLIELRDDVLDEVNQLYFDREHELGPTGDPLRAARFSAGLDSWTGGWFSRASRSCAGP